MNGCADALSNYRPVSNIPFISKLIEKAVLNQLNEHLLVNDLFCSSQSGYRCYHSCETLNIRMFIDIFKDIDEGSTVALLLLDMSAAFDTVDHTLLLRLLKESYDLSGVVLNWFKNYLENRTCAVNILDTFSNFVCLMFGGISGFNSGAHSIYIVHKTYSTYCFKVQLADSALC